MKKLILGAVIGVLCISAAACGQAEEAINTASTQGMDRVAESTIESTSESTIERGSESAAENEIENGIESEVENTIESTAESMAESVEPADDELESADAPAVPMAITEEEYNTFSKTCEAADASGFDDFEETLNQDYLGTWYDPEMGDAIRLYEDGAYVYIPYLNEYGDVFYEWEVMDRSARGLCPELAIYINGRDAGPLAYYVAGYRDGYFYGSVQSFVFYKQEDPKTESN